ncbi:hypothetical protein AB0H51_17230 [Streptomyces griseoluteus]|uniref:hypothetical protein n=1 Tax=Streptomyces griseoluteus TaxID=29306 RepID=UPI0033EE4B2C
MDLTARHPRTGELLSTVKFMVQALAAAGELQRELTYDGLRAAEAKGSKGGRRPAGATDETESVRAAYLEGRSIAALAREHGVSCGPIRTAVADLMPDHTAAHPEGIPTAELPVTLDMPGKVADFLRTIGLEPVKRAALAGPHRTAWPGLHPARHPHPRRTSPAPRPLPAPRRHPGHPSDPGTAQGPPRVREPRQRPHALTMIVLTGDCL